jgi:hypothetical protein
MENLANNHFSTIVKSSVCSRHNHNGLFGNLWNVFNNIKLQNREKTRKRLGTMKTRLRMKCPNCGHWNKVPVNKIFIEQKLQSLRLK